MPIFIPKDISYTPESLKKFEPVEDELQDFIQDPEQFIDTLPQPYRMLNKLLDHIFDNAWEVITSREEERMVEASKIKPPMYSTDIQMEVHGPCKSICSSPKGDVIFVGKTDGLVALNPNTQEVLDEWKDAKMDIANVEVVQAEDANLLVCTIDDLGIGRLFLYSEKTIYFMFAFNEPSEHEENSAADTYGTPMSAMSIRSGRSSQPSQFSVSKPVQKPIITKCQPSSNGDYIGVCFESVQTQENWLDVYKITKESLLKEIETANSRYAKKASPDAPVAAAPEETQEGAPDGEAAQDGALNEEERTDAPEGETTEDAPEVKKSPFSQKSQPDKKSARFTAPQLVLKVKPQQPFMPCNFGSPYAAQNSIDSTGDILSSGLKHQLSTHHLGMKQAVFEHLHEPLTRFIPNPLPVEKPVPKQPSFHFLNPGRLLPNGLDQAALQGQPTYIVVWWEDQYQVLFYPLTKTGKAPKSSRRPGRTPSVTGNPQSSTPMPPSDIEFKPELVWPMSDHVVYSVVSKDASLLAFGLKNNNVVVWDMQMGMPRKSVHISDTGAFFKMQFLDPNIYEEPTTASPLISQQPYKLATNCYLLVVMDDGQNFIVNCGLNDNSQPKQTSSVLKDWEKYTIIEPLQGLPELAVTMRKNGQAFVEDILSGEILLAIEMPPPFKMFMPWQPVFAVGGGGSVLYVRGHHDRATESKFKPDDTEGAPTEVNSLFVFKLRSFRTLDKYRKKTRRTDNSYVVHSLMKERVDCLMKDRISQQPTRQARMQERWTQLKEELELIRDLRDRSYKRNPRSAFSESTIARTPALELQRHAGMA